jgi:outer membrane protein TolC
MHHPMHPPARAGQVLRPASHLPLRLPLLLAAALTLLAGCATVAPDSGFTDIARTTRAHVGFEPRLARDPAAAAELRAAVRQLLAKPLDMDGAVHVALIANPGLQATYWEAGIAQAELAQAARLPNPTLDLQRLGSGGSVQVQRMFTFDLLDILTKPLSMRLEARRFEQTKLDIAARIERQALETRHAWVEAVAAGQALDYARTVDASARASAELGERMGKAGNMTALDLMREQVYAAEAGAAFARAAREAARTREALTRQLGVQGPDIAYTLPGHLPDLPAAPAQLDQVERIALERRLDVQAAKGTAAATAADLGLTRTTRFINVLDLGPMNQAATRMPTLHGYDLTISLPLFDWGGAKVAKAEATYMAALQRVADAAVGAASEARDGYDGYRRAYELARRYRDTIIPLRQRIGKEVLLRYNGMLIGPQDLLSDARDQADAVGAYIDALKEFWLAQATLEGALGMRAADWPTAKPSPGPAPTPAAAPTPGTEPVPVPAPAHAHAAGAHHHEDHQE